MLFSKEFKYFMRIFCSHQLIHKQNSSRSWFGFVCFYYTAGFFFCKEKRDMDLPSQCPALRQGVDWMCLFDDWFWKLYSYCSARNIVIIGNHLKSMSKNRTWIVDMAVMTTIVEGWILPFERLEQGL